MVDVSLPMVHTILFGDADEGKYTIYHAGQNDYRYRSEIKSKTIGLYQITDVTDL